MTNRGDDAQLDWTMGDAEWALEALTRHCTDCVKLVDLDGRMLRWNAACEQVYGYPAHEVMGAVLPHIPEEQRLREIRRLRDIAAEGRVTERDAVAVRQDGSRLTVRKVYIPVRDTDGAVAGLLVLDRDFADDTRLDAMRDDFLAAFSRQVRDPLTALLGYAQLLQRPEIAEDPVRRARTVSALVERAARASLLADDLQLLTELRSGEIELVREPVELASLITSAVAEVPKARKRVLADFDPTIPPVDADRKRLAVALRCLIDNAVRYAPEGTPVGVSVYEVDGDVVIEVSDRGPGIDPADRERIFGRYSTLEDASVAGAGLGIGLFLARHIMEAHGGVVNVASRPGAGATFSLRLPGGRRVTSEEHS